MVKNLFNYKPSPGKRFTQKSITIPDDAMSIREIMNRFSRGIPVPNERPVYYEGDVLNPDLNTMDLTDLEKYQKGILNKLEDIKHQAKTVQEETKVVPENGTQEPVEKTSTNPT